MIAFDALLALAREVGRLTEGILNAAGTATTHIDSRILGVLEWMTDDSLNGGTIFITYDAGAAGAAPENESATIADYDESAYTITTHSGGFTAAPASGDYYACTAVPRYKLFQAVNAAIRDIGFVPSEDDTSLNTAANTREYDLPAAAKRDLRQVWIASDTSAPYDYVECHDWRFVPSRTTGNLVFQTQPRNVRDIRLIYCGPHAILDADSDTINDWIRADWLTWQSAYHYYRRMLHDTGKEDDRYVALMNEAAERAARIPKPLLPPVTTKWYRWPEPDVTLSGARIDTPTIGTS